MDTEYKQFRTDEGSLGSLDLTTPISGVVEIKYGVHTNRSPRLVREVPRNPLTRWDVSSIPANGIFLTKKLKN